ncbi:hypothetical protein JKF63_06021 [Porcisia hertigi]|uniref:AAA+ ATPase domain-containing protein n=1 Tax=Porcisia hertigi TaxID=2761500 RepID=A0A836IXA0_9TRYP|nr:hypothetical protein JKF63_06021 [Porcisia hertigi]
MTGFTDALVLEAPVFWWPEVGNLPQYPLDDQQSFIASIVAAAMPWPQSLVTGKDALTRTVGLSRLGHSVMMTAEWKCPEDIGAEPSPLVKVWNPLQGYAVYLPVSTEVGLGSLANVRCGDEKRSGTASLTALDLRQLTRDERIRLTHRSLRDMLSRCCCPRTALVTRMRQCAQQREEFALLHRAVTLAHTAALKYLDRTAQVMDSVFASSCDKTGKAGLTSSLSWSSSSLLFAGDTPSQQHLLRLLQATTPSVVQVASTTVFALEVRRLNLAEVLTLFESEALEVVEAVCQLPPLCDSISTSSNKARHSSSCTVHVSPCLLIIIESLHLLEANANAMVTNVTHQLCESLDTLRARDVPVIVWSFTEDVGDVPAALLSRVGAQHARFAVATAEDRSVYLTRRLARLPSVSSLSQEACRTAAVAVAENTAHWTVDQLVRLCDADLASMLPFAPALSQKVNDGASSQAEGQHEQQRKGVETQEAEGSVPVTSTTAVVTQPLPPLVRDVYSRLYGMEEAIRKVEELIVWPLTHLPLLRQLGLPCAKGVLLCGPSGTGKTALLSCLGRRLQLQDARHINIMSVDGLSLIEKEVGRSEKNIAQLFDTARALAPTALFIDNLDSLAPPRGRTTRETNTTGDRTLSTLLTQMDGVGGGQADHVVVVVASSPSIDALDPAVCRPGRLDVHVQLTTPPVKASAAVMKHRLRDFVGRMLQRQQSDHALTTKEIAGAATLEVLTQVDQVVDEYFASVAADVQRSADCGAALLRQACLSPAEVTAAIRDVMLAVVARLEGCDGPSAHSATPTFEAHATDRGSDVVRAVRDAVRHLHSLA